MNFTFVFTLIALLSLNGCVSTKPIQPESSVDQHVESNGLTASDAVWPPPTLEPNQKLDCLECPASGPERTETRKAYSIAFSDEHHLARWVAYKLTSEMASATAFEREDNFAQDPTFDAAGPNEAKSSVYDRGHLVPAGDMRFSKQVMNESFFMANIAPQSHKLNRGKWKSLESKIRKLAQESGPLFIATGPILRSDLPKLPNTQTSIPREFYKVILQGSEGQTRAIGFILPQASTEPLPQYAVSIDKAEEVTGLDFFPMLDDVVENRIEAAPPAYASWFDSNETQRYQIMNTSPEESFAVQQGQNFSSDRPGLCPAGFDLKSASKRGCCSHHGGVKPKIPHMACCNSQRQILCSDNTLSPGCGCN